MHTFMHVSIFVFSIRGILPTHVIRHTLGGRCPLHDSAVERVRPASQEFSSGNGCVVLIDAHGVEPTTRLRAVSGACTVTCYRLSVFHEIGGFVAAPALRDKLFEGKNKWKMVVRDWSRLVWWSVHNCEDCEASEEHHHADRRETPWDETQARMV